MASFQACVVTELEKCSDPTPANIVDSIFNFVKRETPCKNILDAESAAATGTKASSNASHLVLSILVIIPFIVASYSNSIPATM